MENIIGEAGQLATRGCRELMLIAQDVTEYGRDLYGSLKLPELLRKLCRTEGIRVDKADVLLRGQDNR